MALAEKAGTPVVGVVQGGVLGNRTSKANAALVWHWRRPHHILVSDTLLAAHSDPGDQSPVFAHELAHHVLRRHLVGAGIEVAARSLAGCYLADYVLTTFALSAGLDGKSDVAGFPLIALAGGVVSMALRPMTNALSRGAHERRANRYASRRQRTQRRSSAR